MDPSGGDRPTTASGSLARHPVVARSSKVCGSPSKAAGVFPKPYVFTGREWPVYRYMDADPDWWTDLPAWRQRVIDEVVACWQVSASDRR